MEFATKRVAIVLSVIRHIYLYIMVGGRYFLKIMLAIAESKGRVGLVDGRYQPQGTLTYTKR